MTLHPCRECRHAVRTEAQACPRCGAVHPAGVSPGALILQGSGPVPAPAVHADMPGPAFWSAMRVIFRRVRIGLYGAGSGLLAAVLTGAWVAQLGRAISVTGVVLALFLCAMAVLLEVLDLHLGKGGAHDH
jgi:hypothetical protein